MTGTMDALTGGHIFILGLAVLLLACQPHVETRGHVTDPNILGKVAVGVQNQDDVRNLLGSPSAVSTFGSDVWYYINERTESVAFFKPKVLERQIVAISFTNGDNKIIEKITHYDVSDARDIDVVDRQTPTAGNEKTLLQELFGNVGRFTGRNDP